MKISIDTSKLKLAKLPKKGEGLLPLAAADEKVLQAILEAEEQLDLIKQDAKEKIAARLTKLGPKVTGLRGAKVRIGYMFYGQKYKIDSSLVESLDQAFYSTEVKYKPNVKVIDRYADKQGEIPYGVNRVDREKSVTFTSLNKSDE